MTALAPTALRVGDLSLQVSANRVAPRIPANIAKTEHAMNTLLHIPRGAIAPSEVTA